MVVVTAGAYYVPDGLNFEVIMKRLRLTNVLSSHKYVAVLIFIVIVNVTFVVSITPVVVVPASISVFVHDTT
jgi:hypothetical protein